MKRLILTVISFGLCAASFASATQCPATAPYLPTNDWVKANFPRVANPGDAFAGALIIPTLPAGQLKVECTYKIYGIPYAISTFHVAPPAEGSNWKGNDQGGYTCPSSSPADCPFTAAASK